MKLSNAVQTISMMAHWGCAAVLNLGMRQVFRFEIVRGHFVFR